MRKYITLILALIAGINMLYGQLLPSVAPYIPTSPQAAAIEKYGNVYVNYSTGTPNISIPLYEINDHGYKLPMTLKYVPQPLKPGYNYQIFGHGWGLSVNSCISRSIEGRPDEWDSFKLESPDTTDYYRDFEYRYNYSSFLIEKNYVHDRFHATLPNGTSFDFVIDNVGGNLVYTVSGGRQVKIECIYTPGDITSFIITDEDGVKYTFADGDTPVDNTYGSSNVSWQLTRIDLPYSKEPIIFSYGKEMGSNQYFTCNYGEPLIIIEEDYHLPLVSAVADNPDDIEFGDCGKTTQPSAYYYKMKLLTSISYGSNSINLSYVDDTGYTYVNDIAIYDSSALIRNIALGISRQWIQDIASTRHLPLAQLDSIMLSGRDAKAVQTYKCQYSGIDEYCTGTDHWGYLNGSNLMNGIANFNLYIGGHEQGTIENEILNNNPMSVVTKDASDPSFLLKIRLNSNNSPLRQSEEPGNQDILTRLIYPTGGYTNFHFKRNQFLTSTDASGNYIPDLSQRTSTSGGGFRIDTITNHTPNGAVSGTEIFKYGEAEDGVGVAVVDPNILTYMSFSTASGCFPIKNIILGIDSTGNPLTSDCLFTYASYYWEASFSALNFRRLLDRRPPVVYPVVTVYHGDWSNGQYTGGKTVYRYNIYATGRNNVTNQLYDKCFFEEPTYYGNVLGYVPKSFLYNNLDERLDYKNENGSYQLIKKEKTNWTNNARAFTDFIYGNQYAYGYFDYYPVSILFGAKQNYYGISLPSTTVTTLYDTRGDSITSIARYVYNSRNQLENKYDTCSNGQDIKTLYSYPELSTGGTTPAVIQQMVDNNIIAPMLKDSVIIGNGQTYHAVAGQKVDYGIYTAGSSTLVMPSAAYTLETSPTPQYVFQSKVLGYSPNGNPLEYVTKDSVHISFIWGYDDRYMIAEVKNASRNQIAFANFENTQDNYGWTSVGSYATGLGKTGLLSGTNVTLDKTNLPSGNYQLSFWAKGSGSVSGSANASVSTTDWKYYQFSLPGISTFNLSTSGINIDDVRLIPQGAMMTTYTYQPSVGMTSQSDAKGVTTDYVYDTFNRLYLTQNDDKNIVARYSYGYQNAPDNGMGGFTTPSGSISTDSASYTPGATGIARVSISGGSGNNTYNWYLKNSSGTTLASSLNTTSTSFSFTCSQSGILTLQCGITDNVTGKTATLSKNINCYAPLSLSLNSPGGYQYGSTGTASATVSGGIGPYSYSWTLSESNGTVLASSTSGSSFSFPCTQISNDLVLKCVVTDNTTNEMATVWQYVSCYVVISVSISTNSSYFYVNNSYTASATVTNGSGNYSYTWYLMDGSYPIQSSTNSTFTFSCPHTGTFYVVCCVTDNTYGQGAEYPKTIVCQ